MLRSVGRILIRSYHTVIMERPIIAVCQMTSTSDKEANFTTCKSLIQTAKNQGASVVFLPEAFDYIAENAEQTLQQSEPLDGPLMQRYCDVARENKIWLSLGGFHEKVENERKTKNAHVIINEGGTIAAVYRKTHLFDVEIPERKIKLVESSYVVPGSEIVPPVPTPAGAVGLGICYDLRFPEFSRSLATMGAHILTYPSAFTVNTGLAHWEVLLRARAIENQCYVVAAAQTGVHNAKRSSYGHAMIVDSWGAIVAQCSEGTGIAIASVDHAYASKIQSEMPVWKHQRSDLYQLHFNDSSVGYPDDEAVLEFGQVKVKGNTVIGMMRYSFAFVNRKCVVPGHVLVAPIRVAARMSDMTPAETQDLFAMACKIQGVMEAIHSATSSTITVQDGEDAGQSIKHVHVHVLPRKPGDFKRNDDIYEHLATHDKEEGGWREDSDMAQEARMIRQYIQNNKIC